MPSPPGGAPASERASRTWASALFFCLFASWYVVRPLRDAMGVLGAVADLPGLFLVTMGVTLTVSTAVSALASRIGPRRLVALVYRLVAATLLASCVLLRGEPPALLAARGFFVWASVANLTLVALAWGLMADLFPHAQGLRVFPLVGAGGTAGAIVGSALAAGLASGPVLVTLVIAAVLLEVAVVCASRVADSAPSAARHPIAVDAPCPEGGAFDWLRAMLARPYILALCGYTVLFTMSSTALYVEQARIVKDSLPGTAARVALFARIDLAVNAVALGLQLSLVGRALRRIGLARVLVVLPGVTLAAFLAMRALPLLGVLIAAQVARRAVDLALAKPARELLFTVTGRADKYKAKNFIDTFVYRGGDALSAWGTASVPAPALVAAMCGVCVTWGVLSWSLGRRGARMADGSGG